MYLKIENLFRINKQNKQTKKNIVFFKSPAFGKEHIQFPDSLDFEKFPDFRTGRDVW